MIALILSLLSITLAKNWDLPGFDREGSHNPPDDYITTETIESLSLKWTFTTGFWAFNQASVKDEHVYFGDFAGHFYGVNLTTGVEIWEVQLDGPVIGGTVVTKNNIYLCTMNGTCYKLNRYDGTTIWVQPTGGLQVWGSPIKIGTQLIVPTVPGSGTGITEFQFFNTCCNGSGTVVSMSTSSGAVQWTWTALENPSGFVNVTVNYPNRFQGLNSTSTLKYGPSGGGSWSKLVYSEDLGLVFGCLGDGYTPMANGKADPSADSCFALDLDGNLRWKRSVRYLRNDFDDWWNDGLYYNGFRNIDPVTPMLYELEDDDDVTRTVIAFGDKAGVWYVWDAATGVPINCQGINTTALTPNSIVTSYGGFNMGPAYTKVQGEVNTFSTSLTSTKLGYCLGSQCINEAYAAGALKAHLFAFSADGTRVVGHFSRNNTLFIGNIAITNKMLFMIDVYNRALLIFDARDISTPLREIDLGSLMQGVGSIGQSLTISNGHVIFGSGVLGFPPVSKFIAFGI